MSEERSVLAAHDAKVKKFRTTRAAAQALVDSEIPADVPDDVAEQAGILMAERQALKDAREIRDCQRPLKALIVALNRASDSTLATPHVILMSSYRTGRASKRGGRDRSKRYT
jgi:hypothetical protein